VEQSKPGAGLRAGHHAEKSLLEVEHWRGRGRLAHTVGCRQILLAQCLCAQREHRGRGHGRRRRGHLVLVCLGDALGLRRGVPKVRVRERVDGAEQERVLADRRRYRSLAAL
jgi:hypothetical protein